MADVVWYAAGLACLVTLGVLVYGIGGFGSGKITPHGQNRLMQWRIIAQFVAVVLIILTALAAKSPGS
ncbi:MAG: twin transmembrane helix small protein [Pseudomonadota bacterium]